MMMVYFKVIRIWYMGCTQPESAKVLNSVLVLQKKCLNCKDLERTDHATFQKFLSVIINLYLAITPLA